MARRKAAQPEKKRKAPRRKPGPEDADVPPEQHPVKQAKNPKQPPREEKAATERPLLGGTIRPGMGSSRPPSRRAGR